MSTRLKNLTVMPWNGGWHTAIDESLIGPNNLTKAEDLFYTTQGTRRQREGINENWDDLAITTVSRASSGTTRTVITTGHVWVTGDQIVVSAAGDSRYNISTVTTVTRVNDTTFTYTAAGALTETTTADTALKVTLRTRVITQCDYWYGTTSAKTHFLMSFTSSGQLYQTNLSTGARTLISDTGTAYTIPSSGLTRAVMCSYENRLIVCTEGANNTTKHYFPAALGGSGALEDITNTTNFAATPKASFCRSYLGRLWLNDKANPDRAHYSETGAYNVWQGAGDSGAIDVGQGDGDPEGLTGFLPPLRGFYFISKRSKMYRIDGNTPDTFSISIVSDNLGCVAHKAAAAIDQTDVVFLSDKGVHSIVATNQADSYIGDYISKDIQPTFNELTYARLPYTQLAYLGKFNTLALSVAESSDSDQNQIYLYNTDQKKWFKWANKSCCSIEVVRDSDQDRFFLGQNTGRLAKTFVGTNVDTNHLGAETSVVMSLATGLIFPAQDPSLDIAFKKFTLIVKATGSYNITSSVKIDNFSTQALNFVNETSGDLLGSTFILGASVLGNLRVTASYTQQVDGLGRGFKISLTQSGESAEADLVGYQLFFEPSEYSQETRTGDST